MAYNELAWSEDILAPPETYEEEALFYVEAIKNSIPVQNVTMLHLGCGAGGHDFHFKEHFSVTGVDISEGMLTLAEKRNPEVNYVTGDMKTICLEREFDVVIIPDSIMYMASIEDLKKTIMNAARHLKPGGILLVVAHMKEDFRENNFAYSGEKENIHITVLENNHIVSDSTYEAAVIYLIRQKGELIVHHEVHTLGLFFYCQWMTVFEECRLKIDEMNMDHLYDQYLLADGEYKLKVFIGTLML
jgi:SAM-dependent methyltransferase